MLTQEELRDTILAEYDLDNYKNVIILANYLKSIELEILGPVINSYKKIHKRDIIGLKAWCMALNYDNLQTALEDGTIDPGIKKTIKDVLSGVDL